MNRRWPFYPWFTSVLVIVGFVALGLVSRWISA